MELKIHPALCNNCRHCSEFFPGLPEEGFEGLPVPQWIIDDDDCMDLILEMIKACESGAASLRT